MQAGLVMKQLSFRDIFIARGFSLRVFIAVVCVSPATTSQNLTRSICRGSAGRPLQGEWPLNQQLMTQATSTLEPALHLFFDTIDVPSTQSLYLAIQLEVFANLVVGQDSKAVDHSQWRASPLDDFGRIEIEVRLMRDG